MFRQKKKTKAQEELMRRALLFTKIQRQLSQAAEMRFPNAAYDRGWRECLLFLNQPVVESNEGKPRQMPATSSRQSSITHRSDRPESTVKDVP